MAKKQKLELTWIGKDQRPKLEPRILIEDSSKSYHAKAKRSDDDVFDNTLIHGDNLLALKALEQEYAGEVKCVFIDPPFNTGQAFLHYDDGIEHSIWLSLMKERIAILRNLLSDDGSMWIVCDENEVHYLKVMCDEVLGRANFVTTVIWRTTDNSNNNAKKFSLDHNHILVYGRSQDWTPKFLNDPEKRKHFRNPNNDPRGPWFDGNPVNNPALRPNLQFDLVAPNGNVIKHPPNGWRWSRETIAEKLETGELRYSADGTRLIRRTYLRDMQGLPPTSLWTDVDATGHNRQAKYELKRLFPERTTSSLFSTPKPEKLVARVLELATEPGDLVLDSFGGSGTTAAVAHKMRRRWIMVELGDHCDEYCLPRLQMVVDADDPGGVTEAAQWSGGGGFRYFELAPSLLEQDKYGNWIISQDYKPEMLAEAMCKHMGFTYAPSDSAEEYWRHGFSTESDFIYVTTQNLTQAALAKIAQDVGPDRSLLICCKAFKADADAFDNLTIIKIPQTILRKCEWGQDDYSLNVANLPMAAPDDDGMPLFAEFETANGAAP